MRSFGVVLVALLLSDFSGLALSSTLVILRLCWGGSLTCLTWDLASLQSFVPSYSTLQKIVEALILRPNVRRPPPIFPECSGGGGGGSGGTGGSGGSANPPAPDVSVRSLSGR